MRTLCFYHSADLDGHCSGALIKFAHPEAELVGIDYGEPFPWDMITEDDTVYMVDFSLQKPEEMERLSAAVKKFIWIDHHKSAIETNSPLYEGLREVGRAACELISEYCFGADQLHPVVELLGRYDVWDQSDKKWWKEVILPFQKGFKDTYPETDPSKNFDLWKRIFSWSYGDDFIPDAVCAGFNVIKNQSIVNAKYLDKYGWDVEFEGLRCIACNKGMTNSQLFDSKWDENKYDAMIEYIHVRGQYFTVSMYSTKADVDVSIICKKYGGGGHKGAAGFQCQKLPFRNVT